MALPTCPDCDSDDLDLKEKLPDGRRHLICLSCDVDFVYGEATVAPPKASDYATARSRFPSAGQVQVDTLQRAEELKTAFLERQPALDPKVPPFWERYQRAFSAEHMDDTPDQDFKDFANSSTGANPGNMAVFNTHWNELGDREAGQRTRDAIRYLLYGPDSVPAEDRLTQLIRPDSGLGMKGFRESLLTKALCIVHPDRFLPILMYSGSAGKREIARAVYGVKLPEREATSATPGRLAYWSNDLLRELVGEGWVSMQHASQFLWWAKDQVKD